MTQRGHFGKADPSQSLG